MLKAQLDELGGVRQKLQAVQQKMGDNLKQFEDSKSARKGLGKRSWRSYRFGTPC